MTQIAALLVFPALMAYSAASDLLTMTISNRISIALVLSFLALSTVCGMGWHAVVIDHLSCGAAVLVLTFAFFAFGWIGGGDAKIAAATTVWIGWDNLADYGLYTSMLGGVLTLTIVAFRHCPLPTNLFRLRWLARLHDTESGVPYGLALAAAGLLLYPQTAIWTAAT